MSGVWNGASWGAGWRPFALTQVEREEVSFRLARYNSSSSSATRDSPSEYVARLRVE